MSGKGRSKVDMLLALFWPRAQGSVRKADPDLDVVDPFERFEAAIRRASEEPEDGSPA